MPTWAPNTDRVVDTQWGRSRQGAAVTGIWIHHQADGAGHDSIDYMIGYNDRGSHPTYAIDDNGEATVVGIIHPDLAPSSTFYVNDRSAVTVEIANTGGAPDWPVSMEALEQVAQIIAHHAKESPRENRAERNQPGVTQKGFWVGIHKQVAATACPGPFVERHWDWIVDRANQILGGSTAPANQPSAPAGGVSIGGSTVGYMYETIDGQRVERNVAAAFDRLAAAFKDTFGLTLHVTSGTRTRAEQQRLYDLYRAGKGNLAARPGTSNHEESGPRGPRALDVRDSGGDPGVARAGTVRANWLRANAPSYGFDPAGYGFSRIEPWHIEFTGAIGGGAADQDTKNRQGWLNEARGEKLAVDGIQGPATTAAIKRYQAFLNERYGTKLAVDGIWGPETQKVHQRYWDELKKPKPAPEPAAQPGPEVMLSWPWTGIQRMLKSDFGYRGAIDNKPGAGTISAFQRFMNARGYGRLAVDGEWGPATCKAAQTWLARRWGYKGAIDGIPGAGTRAAWDQAERENGRVYARVE